MYETANERRQRQADGTAVRLLELRLARLENQTGDITTVLALQVEELQRQVQQLEAQLRAMNKLNRGGQENVQRFDNDVPGNHDRSAPAPEYHR